MGQSIGGMGSEGGRISDIGMHHSLPPFLGLICRHGSMSTRIRGIAGVGLS